MEDWKAKQAARAAAAKVLQALNRAPAAPAMAEEVAA